MIFDNMGNKEMYRNMHRGFDKAFEFLERYQLETPDEDYYEIDGTQVYAMIQRYATVKESELKWEAHKKYIDIQYIMKGSEYIGWAKIGDIAEKNSYDEANDCILTRNPKSQPVFLPLHKDDFAIFFPQDLHKPKCQYDEIACHVTKVVIKIAVN